MFLFFNMRNLYKDYYLKQLPEKETNCLGELLIWGEESRAGHLEWLVRTAQHVHETVRRKSIVLFAN